MACDVNASGFAQVFKMQVGSDNSFVSIFTDTQAAPFDFVVSNNTVYFSNGNSAKKWDPVNGVSNWGIAVGSVSNPNGPNGPGTAADVAVSPPNTWANPNNITISDGAFATATVTSVGTPTDLLKGTNFGFAITSTAAILGVKVDIQGKQTHSGLGDVSPNCSVQLLKGGSLIGSKRFGQFSNNAANAFVSFGGQADLWDTSWTANDINGSSFGAVFQGFFSNATTSWSIDFMRITIYSLGGPPVSVSGSAGTFTAAAGYTYVFCYGNSATGHISSPTPPSLNTGVFTNKASVSVTLTASTDQQVNQIRVFRTTDGGGGTYFELPTSPYSNTSGAITDSAADSALQVGSIAPTPTFNDPPTPFRSPVYFAGRIWGFTGNKVWFSGLEEISQGVPEESFPSGIAGNFWSFDQPVQGLSVAGIGANQVLGILCGGRVYGITGNTLDTFRRFTISTRRGCRNLTCVSALGGMVAWLDSSNMVFGTDGNSLEELSTLIRPDLTGLVPANCSLTFHTAGRFHWLVLSTGSKLYVYDVDQDQWLPPWTFSAKYVFSGETSPGNYVLMASNGTKALQLTPGVFNDNGATYSPVAQLGLMSVIPDYGTRFSYIGVGSYNQPSRTGYPAIFQVTNNGKALKDFLICADEDPTKATYTSIVANLQDTPTVFNRVNGTFMQQQVFPTTAPASRWIGMKIILANLDQTDQLYELFMAYKELGGR